MYSFIICLCVLVLGSFFYGKLVEKIFNPDPNRITPAINHADGVDFIALPTLKVYMIQFLNIAGTGPIFGAIMGAKFGPSAYIWIVLGSIFAGAVHDYLTGMISMRNDGCSLPHMVEMYLGKKTSSVVRLFTVFLLILVGAVFIYSPAQILGDMTGGTNMAFMIWAGVIFLYYIIATLLPVDKVIGRIYPLFAAALLFMAIALLISLLIKWPSLPEFWDGLQNRTKQNGTGQSIFPALFITVACGAISGFHATQGPMMARCMKNETLGRPIFYGAMITEGIVALVWAAISSYFFYGGGAAETGMPLTANAPQVVNAISRSWLGALGGILALLGVVAAPITSGDTSLRSARLIFAEFFHIEQKKNSQRLVIAVPMFAAVAALLWFNIQHTEGFNIIWQYFGWGNQTLAVFTLWTLTVFLARERSGCSYLISMIPACLMTSVCATYICTQKIGLNMPVSWTPAIAAIVGAVSVVLFYIWYGKRRK